jgi:hypothetical protein
MRVSIGTILVGVVTLLPLETLAHARTTEARPTATAEATRWRGGVTAPSAPGATPRGVALGSRADERRYAEKSARSKNARNFRAGDDVVIIGTTTLAIILAIVLVLVLI